MKTENKLVVSDLFVDIYTNLNVCSQIEKMNQLDKEELFLLIILALDKHSDEDPSVVFNLQPFEEEAMIIYDEISPEGENKTKNPHILSLIEKTGSDTIDTSVLVDKDGNALREPLNKAEVRDVKINMIK
jgi:hypothetical protein